MDTVQNEPNETTINISNEQKSQLFDGDEKIQEFESQFESELNNQKSRKSCKKCVWSCTLILIIIVCWICWFIAMNAM